MTAVRAARAVAAAGLLGLLTLAAGCATEPEEVACPTTALLKNTSQTTHFRGSGRDLTDVDFRASVADVAQTCQLVGNVVDIGLAVRLEAERGPANTTGNAPVRYFVAIVDPQRRVLAREAFDVVLPFKEGSKVLVRDELNPRLPLPKGANPAAYTIFVGFVLSRQELEYNRRNP
jgi:hypothetical protein